LIEVALLLELKKIIMCFFKHVEENNIEIYNEFSMQHELGIYLRAALPQYRVQFERNVLFFTKDNKRNRYFDIY